MSVHSKASYYLYDKLQLQEGPVIYSVQHRDLTLTCKNVCKDTAHAHIYLQHQIAERCLLLWNTDRHRNQCVNISRTFVVSITTKAVPVVDSVLAADTGSVVSSSPGDVTVTAGDAGDISVDTISAVCIELE